MSSEYHVFIEKKNVYMYISTGKEVWQYKKEEKCKQTGTKTRKSLSHSSPRLPLSVSNSLAITIHDVTAIHWIGHDRCSSMALKQDWCCIGMQLKIMTYEESEFIHRLTAWPVRDAAWFETNLLHETSSCH